MKTLAPGDQFLNLATEILSQGHSLRFRARGISMRPLIRDGDLLEIRAIRPEQVRLGDVLLYQNGRQSLVHRVVRLQDRGAEKLLLIWGDACLQPDGWVGAKQVLGRVARVERMGRSSSQDLAGQRLLALVLVGILPVYKQFYARLKAYTRQSG
jgi:signal peptidase I